MEITEVRVKLLPVTGGGEKLRGFCTITIDDSFVVRDIKIIQGGRGSFVAMPARRIEVHCPNCGSKNHLRAHFCNDCGRSLPRRDAVGERERLFVDVAHPVNSIARRQVHDAVMREYELELERARAGDYVYARREDFDEGNGFNGDLLEAGN
ncbi:MAG: septation protein SpoVG family protein [Planctomycetes bacterium]|nr:septation protein SpoVG family protein [Planctomycetota bacterium]